MSDETQTADETATEEEKQPKVTVGSIAMQAIREGKTNPEALDAVKAEIPDAKTSLASINWYRNKLRSDGEDVPTARELSKAAKEEAGKTGDGDGDDGDPLD